MTDITMILYGIIFVLTGAAVFVIRKYILPWILTKMSASQWNTIVDWALSLVAFAEKKITGDKMGGIRFNRVLAKLQEICNEHNYKYDQEMLESAIQYAWSVLIGESDTDNAVIEYKPEISE